MSTITKTGGDTSSFDVINDQCTGTTLLPTASCTFQVSFKPASLNSKSADVAVAPTNTTYATAKSISFGGYGIYPQLAITATGSGSRTFTISRANQPDITCSDSCTNTFDTGTVVTLTATTPACVIFTGWSGNCTGTGACNLTLNDNINVSASFSTPHARIRRTGSAYDSLQSAYDAAIDNDFIDVKAMVYQDGFNANRNITVTIDGGYDCKYTNKTGPTTLQGNHVNISGGTVTIKYMVIDK